MKIFSGHYKKVWLIASLLFGMPAFAIDFGVAGQYSKNSDSLVVNGRNIAVSSSGIGLQVSDTVLKDYLYLSAGALYGASGDASANFSGASVSGPAKLTTVYGVIKAYALPDHWWTLMGYYSILNNTGDTSFSGYRSTSQAIGTASFSYDQQALGVGVRFLLMPDLCLELITGKHDWKLLSNAVGTLGTLNASTSIEGSNRDNFNMASLRYKLGDWTYSGEYGAYVLRYDNQVTTNNFKLSLSYRF
jgi:hypothetical protein